MHTCTNAVRLFSSPKDRDTPGALAPAQLYSRDVHTSMQGVHLSISRMQHCTARGDGSRHRADARISASVHAHMNLVMIIR